MEIKAGLEKHIKGKGIKDIIIFASSLFSQSQRTIEAVRRISPAPRIHLFYRIEDAQNISIEKLPQINGVTFSPYRLNISSFFKIRKTGARIAIILCDNPYSIGYRKAKLFSLICGAETVLFSNILDEASYFSLSDVWKDRTKIIRCSVYTAVDTAAAPLFYAAVISAAYCLKPFIRRKRYEDSPV